MTGTLIELLILLGVLAIVITAAWFILQQMQLPEPIHRIVVIVLVVIVAVLAVILLLRLPGGKIGLGMMPVFALSHFNKRERIYMTTKKEEHRNQVKEEIHKPPPPKPPEHLGEVTTGKPDPFETPKDSHPQNPPAEGGEK